MAFLFGRIVYDRGMPAPKINFRTKQQKFQVGKRQTHAPSRLKIRKNYEQENMRKKRDSKMTIFGCGIA